MHRSVTVRTEVEELGGVRIPGSQDQEPSCRQEASSGGKVELGSGARVWGSEQANVRSRSKQPLCTTAQTAPCDDFLVYTPAWANQWAVGGHHSGLAGRYFLQCLAPQGPPVETRCRSVIAWHPHSLRFWSCRFLQQCTEAGGQRGQRSWMQQGSAF